MEQHIGGPGLDDIIVVLVSFLYLFLQVLSVLFLSNNFLADDLGMLTFHLLFLFLFLCLFFDLLLLFLLLLFQF